MVLRVGLNALAVWLAVAIVGGLQFDGNWVALIAIAIVLAVVNAVVKPLILVLSLPAIFVTLGFFLLFVNAAMLGITIWISGRLDLGLTSTGFGATFLGALVVSVVAWWGERLLPIDD